MEKSQILALHEKLGGGGEVHGSGGGLFIESPTPESRLDQSH
jgi:hypothetical protein